MASKNKAPESITDGLRAEFQEKISSAAGPELKGITERRASGRLEAMPASGLMNTEAIIIVNEFERPALLVRNNTFEEPQAALWKQLLDPNRTKLDKAIRSVGRVNLQNHPTYPWVGTAWMVSEDIAITNRHVGMEFARKKGRAYEFIKGVGSVTVSASINFREEYGLGPGRQILVEKVLYIADTAERFADVSLLKLKKGTLPDPIELYDQKPVLHQKIVVIGYPANDPRNPAPAVTRIFGNIFEVKRFSPGEVSGGVSGFTFTHDSSTLGGNSGSAVIDVDSGKAVGLHFAGSFRQANYAVASSELKRLLKSLRVQVSVPSSFAPKPPKIEVETPTKASYKNSEGFQTKFLGAKFDVPLPKLKKAVASSIAPVDGTSDNVLLYTHFSIAMNKDRRFAFYTAVNIDGSQSLAIRRTRDKWYFDPRIAKEHQVGPELYVNNDLDRGHLVRRLDPDWGAKAVAETANEQTFHFTNCTPQHAQFNQKNWNDLEDYILDNAGVYDLKVNVFTGPVFDDNDPLYRDIQLPQQYWKVVSMVKDSSPKELSVTGYILSQTDLLTNLEFVFGQFRTYQLPVSKIEELTKLDFGKLKDSDPLYKQESFAIRELTSLDQITF